MMGAQVKDFRREYEKFLKLCKKKMRGWLGEGDSKYCTCVNDGGIHSLSR